MFSTRQMILVDIGRMVEIDNQNMFEAWLPHIFKDCITFSYYAQVLLDNDKVIGYAIACHENDSAHLLRVCIDEKYKTYGHGNKMFGDMVKTLKSDHPEIENIYGESNVSNFTSIKMFERHGFKREGIHIGYYVGKNGREHAVQMIKHFKIGETE